MTTLPTLARTLERRLHLPAHLLLTPTPPPHTHLRIVVLSPRADVAAVVLDRLNHVVKGACLARLCVTSVEGNPERPLMEQGAREVLLGERDALQGGGKIRKGRGV